MKYGHDENSKLLIAEGVSLARGRPPAGWGSLYGAADGRRFRRDRHLEMKFSTQFKTLEQKYLRSGLVPSGIVAIQQEFTQ